MCESTECKFAFWENVHLKSACPSALRGPLSLAVKDAASECSVWDDDIQLDRVTRRTLALSRVVPM